jgi:hypothetical protein
MAYLAEKHDIWGPFLVIAPASTLHNWQQELVRFVPGLKTLPYWGNVKDRTVLRKFWNRKSLRYDKDAPFHVLVTSYQLVRLSAFSGDVAEGSLGCRGREVLPARQVAVHDLGRSASDQIVHVGTVEDPSRLQLPQPPSAHRYAYPKQHARTVGPPPFHHALSLRLARRVQRLVLEGHRVQRQEWQHERGPAAPPPHDPEAVHASPHQEECPERAWRQGHARITAAHAS